MTSTAFEGQMPTVDAESDQSVGEPPSETALVLQRLKTWSERGWIRRLDNAFAGFMVDLCADSPAVVAPNGKVEDHARTFPTVANLVRRRARYQGVPSTRRGRFGHSCGGPRSKARRARARRSGR